MADIVLGLDENLSYSEDIAFQDTVAKILEDAGHSVEKLSRAPGPFSAYSYSSKANGKIGIYLIADGIFAIADLAFGGTSFKYGYFGIRGDLGRLTSQSEFESSPIGRDPDCTSICDRLAGKTYPQINDIVKDKCYCVFGKNAEEMGKALLAAMDGEVPSDDGSSSGSTIKDALKQACSGWDGECEILCIEDTVYVHKIADPTTTELVINEYDNVQYDSVTITDANPQTPNKITMEYEGKTLGLQDDRMIERFEENPTTVEPDEFVKSYEDAIAFLQRNWNKVRRDSGRQVELKLDGDMKWQTGVWARVYLPSFFIDDYMYVSRCSHEEDSSTPWNVSLTLVDYPPSFGTFEDTSSEEEEEEEEELDETDVDADAEETT